MCNVFITMPTSNNCLFGLFCLVPCLLPDLSGSLTVSRYVLSRVGQELHTLVHLFISGLNHSHVVTLLVLLMFGK